MKPPFNFELNIWWTFKQFLLDDEFKEFQQQLCYVLWGMLRKHVPISSVSLKGFTDMMNLSVKRGCWTGKRRDCYAFEMEFLSKRVQKSVYFYIGYLLGGRIPFCRLLP